MAPNGPPSTPSFGALFLANLKVVGVALLLALLCFGAWHALRWMFPEWAWLNPGN